MTSTMWIKLTKTEPPKEECAAVQQIYRSQRAQTPQATQNETESAETTSPQDTPLIPSAPQPPTYSEDDINPFGDSGEDASAVEAAQRLIPKEAEELQVMTQVTSPKAFAYAHMVTKWEQMEGAVELSELDEWFLQSLERFECGRKGKENRAQLYADVVKALRQHESDMELTTGQKLMGR